jgi:virginiamycin A acetyltransferase
MGTVSPLPTVVTRRSEPGALRHALKRAFLTLAWIVASPLIIAAWLESRICGPGCKRVFGAAKEMLSLWPGLIGVYVRTAFYCSACRDVSPDACFSIGSMVASRDVAIGAGTVVGAYSIIGRSEIGRDVLIASRVSVISDPYLHGRPSDRVLGRSGGGPSKPPRIGDECWIGENAVILASIGERSSVAAGAVVARPAEAGTTLMGNPARKVNL